MWPLLRFLQQILAFQPAKLSHVTRLDINELISLLKTGTAILMDDSVWLFVNNANAFSVKKPDSGYSV